MIRTIADQYLAQNAGRRYPLADDTVGLSDASVLDARFTVSGIATGSHVVPYVTGVEQLQNGEERVTRVSIDLRTGRDTVDSLRFDIPSTIEDTYKAEALSDRAIGELVVTRTIVDDVYRGPEIRMSSTTVVCKSLGVDSIQGIGAIDHPVSEVISGDIVLDPGKNVDPYLDGQHIRLDIFKGAGIGERCQYPESGQTCGMVMFTINGEKPGSDGALRITGNGGITVTPVPEENTIVIALDSVSSDKMTGTCEPAC